jgi:2-polyprenyl-3-methyl-5-hydroxy-6-metoxy-1,4-benzoquinol methylase
LNSTVHQTKIEFEEAICIICDKNNTHPAGEVVWRGNTLQYCVCGNCGLKFMNPRPTRDWYRNFYINEFWEDKFANRSWRGKGMFELLWRLLKGGVSGRLSKGRKRALQVVPEILSRKSLTSASKVLDVGCAFGMILEEIKAKTNATVYGVEPNDSARAEAEKRVGVEFIGRTAEDLVAITGMDGTFDIIIFSNVLENIVDPRPVLQAARRLLNNDGLLYVDTPNVFYYDAMNPYHPYVYSPTSLSNLLSACDFEILESVFEPPTDRENEGLPFNCKRPRFVTAYSRKSTRVNRIVHKFDSETYRKSALLSLQRYARIKSRN